MKSNTFFSNIVESTLNKEILEKIKAYIEQNKDIQLYLIRAPLGENKYSYEYEDKAIVILCPKYKIIFLDLLGTSKSEFDKYCDDFIEDLGSISDKFNYKKYIGRPKEWEQDLIARESVNKGFFKNLITEEFNFGKTLEKHKLDHPLHRKAELLISLLVGSVNDLGRIGGADEPDTLLEKIKNKIVLFDGDQTRFIYEKNSKKTISIQGLAGTGKTELLLHKLKEIYTQSDTTKIFFTCKNVALSRELNKRIPDFFNSMKVEKQIEKNKRLWVSNAWGSLSDPNSGLYRYICHFYNVPFFTYGQVSDFEKALKFTIGEIIKINPTNFKCALDYILIDESQDFPEALFELCKMVTSSQIYIAGDLFQDIFSEQMDTRNINPDYILNKCYRTDPRTLMFAQSIGMGLFETPHLNWLPDASWRDIGYILSRDTTNTYLSREPIRRFDDLDMDTYKSMQIIPITSGYVNDTILVIRQIMEQNPTVKPDDIGIIFLDDYGSLCDFSNRLEFELSSQLGWAVNKAYENKQKVENQIFITNQNHVKGLEFPFVICITKKILNNYSYRNALYTMLTRSFLQSYLLVRDTTGLEPQIEGLRIINEDKHIKTIEPTSEELEQIKKTIIEYSKKQDMSYRDFVHSILEETGEESRINEAINLLSASKHANIFDEANIKEFLALNKAHF